MIYGFQEVYFLYNQQEVIQATTVMKLFQPAMMAFQLIELSCYSFLFGLTARHDKEMKENHIISLDAFMARKHMNVFSLKAQVFGCITEIIYQLIIFVIRFTGSKFFPQYIESTRNYVNLFFISQFAITSTLQILVSPDLRKKFFAHFQQ